MVRRKKIINQVERKKKQKKKFNRKCAYKQSYNTQFAQDVISLQWSGNFNMGGWGGIQM
jgi:hypothetical protein